MHLFFPSLLSLEPSLYPFNFDIPFFLSHSPFLLFSLSLFSPQITSTDIPLGLREGWGGAYFQNTLLVMIILVSLKLFSFFFTGEYLCFSFDRQPLIGPHLTQPIKWVFFYPRLFFIYFFSSLFLVTVCFYKKKPFISSCEVGNFLRGGRHKHKSPINEVMVRSQIFINSCWNRCQCMMSACFRRSAILSCPFGKIPKTAIPVSIPVVPSSTERIFRPAAAAVSSRPREPERLPPAVQPVPPPPPQTLEEITSLASSIVITTDDSLGRCAAGLLCKVFRDTRKLRINFFLSLFL